jgi:chemosensory pili system protein ChpA (sensor histidine kinase/response regulator)
MATAMLFVEHGLDQVRQLPDDFGQHAEAVGARLLALAAGETPPERAAVAERTGAPDAAGPDGGRAGGRNQNRPAPGREGARRILRDPARRPALVQADPVLHQLQGALAILDQEDAMRAALHVKAACRHWPAATARSRAGAEAALHDIAQNVGALGFFVDMLAQNAAGARERFAFDAEQGTFRSVPFKKMPASESIPVLEEQVPAPAPLSMPVEAPPPAASDAAVEAELLEIFITEAQEVLAFVDATLAKPRLESGSEENLTMLRRSFHTLKGSGRMVGLNQFADAAHGIERVMNMWLADARPPTDALFALLNHAALEMGAWVAELAANGVSSRNADALVAAAERVQEGGDFVIDEPVPATVEEAPPIQEEIEALAPPSEDEPEEIAFELSEPEAPPAPTLPPVVHGNVIEFPTIAQPVPRDDNVKHIGELEIPLPLYNIYLHETDELVRLLVRDFGEWRHEPRRPVNPDALQASHTLAGTSGTVGFKALRELALALESTLQSLLPPAPHLDQVQHDLLDFTIERIRQMLQSFAAGEMPAAQPELITALQDLRAELAATPPAASNDIEARLDDLVAETMDSITAPPPPAVEPPLDQLFREAYNAISGSVPESEAAVPAPVPKKPEVHADDGIDDLFNSTTSWTPTCCRSSWKKAADLLPQIGKACASGSRTRRHRRRSKACCAPCTR